MKRLLISAAAVALSTTALSAAPDMASADVDGDGFASKEELQAVYQGLTDEEFISIDANGDNRLDPNEIYLEAAQDMLKRYEPGTDADTATTVTVLQVTDLDTDGDGFVSQAELVVGYPGLLDEEFVAIDVNGDGRIDSDELVAEETQTVVARYAVVTEQAPSTVVEVTMFDTDADGFVSEPEIIAVFPDFDPTFFGEIDLNGDNRLSVEEVEAEPAQVLWQRYM